jgi:hypothetical protein
MEIVTMKWKQIFDVAMEVDARTLQVVQLAKTNGESFMGISKIFMIT